MISSKHNISVEVIKENLIFSLGKIISKADFYFLLLKNGAFYCEWLVSFSEIMQVG